MGIVSKYVLKETSLTHFNDCCQGIPHFGAMRSFIFVCYIACELLNFQSFVLFQLLFVLALDNYFVLSTFALLSYCQCCPVICCGEKVSNRLKQYI